MTDQSERAAVRTDHRRTGLPRYLTRLAGGTVVAAGILGALAISPEAVDQTPVSNVAMTIAPMQPPVPPGPPVPPPMQEPGQEPPGSSIHDQPPGPAPAEPNENAICQDIMGLPDSGKMINPDCVDPSQWA